MKLQYIGVSMNTIVSQSFHLTSRYLNYQEWGRAGPRALRGEGTAFMLPNLQEGFMGQLQRGYGIAP